MGTLYSQNFAAIANGVDLATNPPNFAYWSHDAYSARTWQVASPSGIKQAQLSVTAAGNWSFAVYKGITSVNSFDYSAALYKNGSSTDDTGLLFRASQRVDGQWPNAYSFGYSDDTHLRILIYDQALGPSVLVAAVPAAYHDGVVLRVVGNGSRFQCYEDGVIKYDFANVSWSTGGVGFISRQVAAGEGSPGWANLVVNDMGNLRRRGRA